MNIQSNPSLYIPRVYPNISELRIRKIFEDLSIGLIDRLEIISNTSKKGEKYNIVYIHFQSWYINSYAQEIKQKLLKNKDIKITYDDPWFWKVSASWPASHGVNVPILSDVVWVKVLKEPELEEGEIVENE
jgi:hypothetical protein